MDRFSVDKNNPRLHLVMDRGLYSKANVDQLCSEGHHFTLGIPGHLIWVREEIDRFRDEMHGPTGYRKVGDEVLYVHTHLLSWGKGKRRCYAQLYYNAQRAAEEYDDFTRRLLDYKEELEAEKPVAQHEEAYRQFFFIKRTPKRGLQVSFNNDAIEAHRNRYSGFFMILTTQFKDPLEALRVYREKDVVEKCFDNLKNDLDMKRLRVQNAERMNARLFIQFIALICTSQIRQTMEEKLANKNYTPKTLLLELESLTTIHYTGKYKNRLTEITKAQRQILEAFNVLPDA